MSEQPFSTFRVRILLVDDERSLLEPLTAFLNRYFTVEGALSGQAALDLVEKRQGNFDVALVDETLIPGPDGIEVMETIRGHYPNIEVIIFTGWGPEQRQNALRAGAFRYLEKPVDKEELVLLIRSAAQQVRFRDISREILATHGLDGLQDAIINAAGSLVFADDAALVFVHPLTFKFHIRKSQIAKDAKPCFYRHLQNTGLTQEIIRRCEAYSIPDTQADLAVDSCLVDAGFQSFVAMPIPGERGPQGVLYVYSKESRHFDELGHNALLRTIAAQAGLALTNAWAEEQLRLHSLYMEALVSASRELSAAQSQQEMFEIAWRFVQEKLGISIFYIALYEPFTDRLIFPIYIDQGVRLEHPERKLGGRSTWGATGYVVHTGEEVSWRNLAEEAAFCEQNHIILQIHGTHSKSCFFYPLWMHGDVAGVISVQSETEAGLPALYLDALRALGNHLCVAILNLRHHEQVEHTKRLLEAVTEASRHIRSESEPRRLLFETVHQAADLMGFSLGALLYFNSSLQEMEVIAPYNLPDDLIGKRFSAPLSLAGKAAAKGTSETFQDDYEEAYPYDLLLFGLGIQSALAVPIQHPNDPETQRILLMADPQARQVSAEDLEVLERLVDTAAIAIRTSMLISGEKNRFDQLTILQKIYEFIQARRDLDDILHLVLTGITADYGLGFNRAVLLLADQENDGMLGRKAIGYLDAEEARNDWQESHHAGLDTFSAYLRTLNEGALPCTPLQQIMEGKTFISPDEQLSSFLDYLRKQPSHRVEPSGLSHIPGFAQAFEPSGKMLVVPLYVAGEIIGMVVVDNKFNLAPISAESESALVTFANVAGLAIENERLLSNLQRTRDAAFKITKASVLGDLKESLVTIRESARQVLDCDMFTLYIYDAGTGKFTGREHFGSLDVAHIRFPEQLAVTSSPYQVLQFTEPGYHYTENTAHDSFFKGTFAQDEKIKATLAIKLSYQNEPVGALFINYRAPHHFTQEEIDTALLFADQAAISIQNARLYSQVDQHTQYLQQLYEAGNVIASSLSLPEILQHLAEYARRLTGIEGVEACFCDVLLEENGLLHYVACAPAGITTGASPVYPHATPPGIIGRAYLSGGAQLVPDVHQNSDYLEFDPRTQSELAVPLRSGDKIIGVINVESHRKEEFNEADRHNLELLAAQATIAIENARAYDELRKAQGVIGARTALAWTGMSATVWRHSIVKDALTIRDQLGLVRMDLEKNPSWAKKEKLQERLDMIERLANRILARPITTPLSSEEGVEAVLVNSLVKERVTQLWQRPDYPPVTFELSFELANESAVWASPEWLRRALDVLVENAVREVHQCSEKHLIIGTRPAGSKELEIYVSDSGRGVPPDIWAKLGEEFLPRSPGSHSMGVGLMFAQIIAGTYHGSLVKIKSGPTGTEIGLRFPILNAQAKTS
jgi:GAF domain-containing protein